MAVKEATLKKGQVGYNKEFGWPLIVMQNYYGKQPTGAVPVEVFGFEQECGSIYLKDIQTATLLEEWKAAVKEQGKNPDDRYFKGEIFAVEVSA